MEARAAFSRTGGGRGRGRAGDQLQLRPGGHVCAGYPLPIAIVKRVAPGLHSILQMSFVGSAAVFWKTTAVKPIVDLEQIGQFGRTAIANQELHPDSPVPVPAESVKMTVYARLAQTLARGFVRTGPV